MIFCPLTKIDEASQTVHVRVASEVPDKAREIMDYASAKPQFVEWSEGYQKRTGGLSKGNVRVMHQKTVAGRLDDLSFNDAEKAVDASLKISDQNEWNKVMDGAYTGVSIGGGYLRKWKDQDTGMTRYTPIVREISLVDDPCMPTSIFADLHKLNGEVEKLKLRGVPRSFQEMWSLRPQTFGELMNKSVLAKFDESKIKRDESGKFASIGSAVGGVGGALKAGGHGIRIGGAIGERVGNAVGREFATRSTARTVGIPVGTAHSLLGRFGGLEHNPSVLAGRAGGRVAGAIGLGLGAAYLGAKAGSSVGHAIGRWIDRRTAARKATKVT